jgi:hypothetical protein
MMLAVALQETSLPPQDAPPPEAQDVPITQDAPPPDKRDDETDPAVTIQGRRRPDFRKPLPPPVVQNNPGAVRAPLPEAFPTDQIPIPDRYRLIQTLGLVTENPLDPYHQNSLKGDRPIDPHKVRWLPIRGDDWFFRADLISDTVIEPRTFPIPVGVQTTERPQSLDVFGKDASVVYSQTFIASASLFKGSTAFKPPEIEYRVAFAFNISHVNVPERRVLNVAPSKASIRTDSFLGVQEFFVDYHIRNVSDRYDFDSVRVGIQPFQSDFRGFLFNDQQLGIRLFGNRDGNRFQYNIGAFWRLEKDTNSGLNSVITAPRDDFVLVANVYRQDFLIPGLTSQVIALFNHNREGNGIQIDDNGFPVRPALLGDLRGHDYDVAYVGYNADGRIGRINVTASAYGAIGHDNHNFFTSRPAKIRAFFGATELSYDHNWMRFRLSALYASGDKDPYDDTEGGYDAVFENPVFAGADTSYWIRQSIPFAGGGRAISISGRNGILNSLRSSKEEGQSNFNNPGTFLIGIGADFDITPGVRVSGNANRLAFVNTSSIQTLRNEGSIPKGIGWDLSASVIWRPRANQNMVFRLSGAILQPDKGFRDLFENRSRDRRYVSVLANVVLSY